MPKENIGEFGDGQLPREREWVSACYEFAIAYLKRVCGEPPKGYTLEMVYHDYESLSSVMAIPSLGITWENPYADAPWEYMQKCEIALGILDAAIDWGAIDPESVQEYLPEDEEEDEN